jgi:hypothetical protein
MPRKKGVPYARTDALKKRRNFSLTEKAIQGLGRLVSLFNLDSASAMLEAIGRGELFLSTRPQSFSSLLAAWDIPELASMSGIPEERITEIRSGTGDSVQLDELIGLARATGISFEVLERLARYQGVHQKNGC